jgi:hypothetical protein
MNMRANTELTEIELERIEQFIEALLKLKNTYGITLRKIPMYHFLPWLESLAARKRAGMKKKL